MTDPTDLIARLKAKRQTMPVLGSGSTNGDSVIYDDGMRLVNPDGPEAAAEIQRLRDEVAEWKERYNRKDGEYGRAIEAAYCCVRCGKPTPLAQARKEALEEAAAFIASKSVHGLGNSAYDNAYDDACARLASALRSRAGEIG